MKTIKFKYRDDGSWHDLFGIILIGFLFILSKLPITKLFVKRSKK